MKKLYSFTSAILFLSISWSSKCQISNYDIIMPLIEKNDSWPFEPCLGVTNDLIVFEDTLYVVGTFQEFNGESLNGVFKWDGEHIHAANAPFDISNAGANSQVGVHCINTFNEHIVVGVKENYSDSRVFMLQDDQWTQLGNSLEVNTMCAIIEWNEKLYITGEGDTPLFVLNNQNIWEPVNVPFTGTPNDLEVYFGVLYCNNKIGNNGQLWKNTGIGFQLALPNLNFEDTESIDVINGQLYAFGNFISNQFSSLIINISNIVPIGIPANGTSGAGAFLYENQFYRCVSSGYYQNIYDENDFVVAQFNSSNTNSEKLNPKIIVYKDEVFLSNAFILNTTTDYNFSSLGSFVPKKLQSISNEQINFGKHSTLGIINNEYYNTSNLAHQNEYNPNFMNKRVINSSSFILSATVDNSKKINAYIVSGLPNNLFAGPVSDNYTIETYRKFDRIWTVSENEIQSHIQNWNSLTYDMPESIEQWPGNGNFELGEPHMLAPFHDENQNSWYEPQLGDYPLIRGKEAAFWITHGKETSAFPDALLAEIHVMCYIEEPTDNFSGSLLFFHNKIINRSEVAYDSLRIGVHNGFSLGYSSDNFIGCDSLLSCSYVYNGDNFDESTLIEHFGYETPALATIFLNEAMQVNTNFNVGFNEYNGRPIETIDFYNYMQGKFKNGDYLIEENLNFGTGPMMFQDSPCGMGTENEIALGNPAGDRRLISAGELHTLLPNESLCFDFAYYFKPASGDNIETLCALLEDIPAIHTFYENQNYGCTYINSIDENEEPNNWSVFPNPTSDIVKLQIEGMNPHTKVEIKVLDMQGREVMHLSPTSDGGNVILDLSNLSVGSYFITARVEEKIYTKLVTRE